MRINIALWMAAMAFFVAVSGDSACFAQSGIAHGSKNNPAGVALGGPQ